jgi:ribosome-associated translation inhibitor RaiA
MEKIRYVGLNKFDDSERKIVNEIVNKHLKDITRSIKDPELVIDVKKHSTSNKKIDERVNYSVHAKIQHPQIIISASSDDWDLKVAIHKAMEKLHNEIKHKFKPDRKSWIKFWRKDTDV